MNAEFRIIGQPRPQLVGSDKVRGRAEYTHDVTLPGMLFGAILRSPHAHAHIWSVDLSKARAMPGVVAVICEVDFPNLNYVNAGPVFADRAAMARSNVRFVGEEVAAVAAETLAEAQAGLAAIAVEYDPLPAVFDVDEALAPDAPAIHDKPTCRAMSRSKALPISTASKRPSRGPHISSMRRLNMASSRRSVSKPTVSSQNT